MIIKLNVTTVPLLANPYATLIITSVFNQLGPPLPPDPVLVILCASQLEIQWEVPYSPDNFIIESYNIEVVNETTGDVQLDVIQLNQTRHRLALDGVDQVMSCDVLTVSVTAVSAVGESEPGMVSGGFPIGKLTRLMRISVPRDLDSLP